jgi:hypothetical protein
MTSSQTLANSQAINIDGAGHAQYRGVALAPVVAMSDKGTEPQRHLPSSPNAALSRTTARDKMLAFKPGFSHNFTMDKVEQVPVKHARGAMRTI